jgi:glycerol uptake facilitator protein
MYSTPQKLVAEFFGTFAIVFLAAGAVCADQFLKTAPTPAARPGLLGTALVYGLAVGGVISALRHISGAHLNPAVTIGFWVTRRMDTFQALLYWVAQLAGASAAASLLMAAIPSDVWQGVNLGTPSLAPSFTRANGMMLEAALTFLIVWVFFATAVDEKSAAGKLAGACAGLVVFAGTAVAYPFTGAALNPARAFGPALASGFWSAHLVYWVGPLFGGALAAALYSRLYLPDETGGGARPA